jgi:hypothetical protein
VFSLFSRNAQRLPLSPQERAFLAFFWHLLLSTFANAFFAAAQAVFLYITIHGTLGLHLYQWWPMVALQLWNIVMALLVGVRKYITAHADIPYGQQLGTLLDEGQATVAALAPAPLPAAIADQNTQTGLAAVTAVK